MTNTQTKNELKEVWEKRIKSGEFEQGFMQLAMEVSPTKLAEAISQAIQADRERIWEEMRTGLNKLWEEKPRVTSITSTIILPHGADTDKKRTREAELYMYSLAQFNRIAGVQNTIKTLLSYTKDIILKKK